MKEATRTAPPTIPPTGPELTPQMMTKMTARMAQPARAPSRVTRTQAESRRREHQEDRERRRQQLRFEVGEAAVERHQSRSGHRNPRIEAATSNPRGEHDVRQPDQSLDHEDRNPAFSNEQPNQRQEVAVERSERIGFPAEQPVALDDSGREGLVCLGVQDHELAQQRVAQDVGQEDHAQQRRDSQHDQECPLRRHPGSMSQLPPARERASVRFAFGVGEHFCIGAHLARMTSETLFRELVGRLEAVELVGTPERTASNLVPGLERLPIHYRITPAA
jgi:hypothetical protein